jgi:hypothetical protein
VADEIAAALNAVLRRAVAAKDGALIEAYREIYQKGTFGSRENHPEKVHAALRLGVLLGDEIRARRSGRMSTMSGGS